MAESGENDRGLPPSSTGDPPVPGDEGTAGKTHCEASFSNGDCGISANMVGSGSIAVPGSQAGLDAANTSVGMDAKSGIPRRSSIIKVSGPGRQLYDLGSCDSACMSGGTQSYACSIADLVS